MNIYAFPLSHAEIIRLESIDDLIDRLAWEALTEIRRMADEARAEFAPISQPMPVRDWVTVLNEIFALQNSLLPDRVTAPPTTATPAPSPAGSRTTSR
jgi:hypothetical protein